MDAFAFLDIAIKAILIIALLTVLFLIGFAFGVGYIIAS